MPPDSPAPKSSAVGGLLFRTLNSVEESHQSLAFSGPTSPFSPASTPGLKESALTIADVMPQLPPELARTTFLPQDQPVKIAPSVLNQALSSGQLTIPMFEVYRVCPGIFQTPVSPDDARLIQLPHSKLSALVSLATTAQAPKPNHSPNPYNPGPVAPFAPAPANSPFSTIAISSPFGIQVDGRTPSPRMDSFPHAATKQKATLLPPRRDSAQAPDPAVPPSPSEPAAPLSAVAETPTAPPSTQPPEPQPLSLFPNPLVSPFAVANPEVPSAAQSPSPFGLLEFAAASPFALADLPEQPTQQTLINGPATASVSNLLKEQPSDALGFDPALVPSWITTQLSAGVVADLNAMNDPEIELGTIVDGITDLGFRSMLRSARRHHIIPIALRSLSPVNEAGIQSAVTVVTPPLSPPVDSRPLPSTSLLPTGFSSPESPIPSEKVKLNDPSSAESNASLIRPLAHNAEPPVSPASPAPPSPPLPSVGRDATSASSEKLPTTSVPHQQQPHNIPPYLEFASALDPFASAGDAYYNPDASHSGFSSFDLMGGSPTMDSPPPSLFSHEQEPALHSDLPEISSSAENRKVSGWPIYPEQNTVVSSPQPVDQAVPPHSINPPTQTATDTSSMGLSATTAGAEEQLMLRALLGTDEKLTLARVMELTVNLPGISACALVEGDRVLAAESIQNSDSNTFHSHAVEVVRSLRTLAPLIGIADAETFTLNTANRLITLCFPGTVTLVILHDRDPSLGLRDKLTLIARQLARMIPVS